jgi:SAM-dependent methyltransferase
VTNRHVNIVTDEVKSDAFGQSLSSIEIASGSDFEYETCGNTFRFVSSADKTHFVLVPRPSPQSLPTIYPPSYEPFNFTALPSPIRQVREFVQGRKARAISKSVAPGGRMLDVGCGSGALLKSLRSLRGSVDGLAGCDFAGPHLQHLRDESFEVFEGLVPGRDSEPFDGVILLQVLEHLDDPLTTLCQLREKMTIGGTILIETPSFAGLDARLFRKRHWGGYHFPRHFWIFSDQSLRSLLTAAGFRTEEVRYLPAPAFWIQSFHHSLFDRGHIRASRLFVLKNLPLLCLASAVDILLIALGKPTSNIRITATKI